MQFSLGRQCPWFRQHCQIYRPWQFIHIWSLWATRPLKMAHLKKARAHCISGHVQAGPGDHQLVSDAYGQYHSQVHLGEKECSGRPTKLSGSVFLMKWFPLLQLFNGICKEYGRPFINLSTTRVNNSLPLYMSPILDRMAQNEAAFRHWLEDPSIDAFPHSLFWDRACREYCFLAISPWWW